MIIISPSILEASSANDFKSIRSPGMTLGTPDRLTDFCFAQSFVSYPDGAIIDELGVFVI